MMNMHDRYQNDPEFRQLVVALEMMIESCHLTPSELREAAILAYIHFDQRRPFSRLVESEVELVRHEMLKPPIVIKY